MISRSKKYNNNTHTTARFFSTKSDKHFLSLVSLLKFVCCCLFSLPQFLAANFFFLSFFCLVSILQSIRPTKKKLHTHEMLALNRISIYVLFVSFFSLVRLLCCRCSCCCWFYFFRDCEAPVVMQFIGWMWNDTPHTLCNILYKHTVQWVHCTCCTAKVAVLTNRSVCLIYIYIYMYTEWCACTVHIFSLPFRQDMIFNTCVWFPHPKARMRTFFFGNQYKEYPQTVLLLNE